VRHEPHLRASINICWPRKNAKCSLGLRDAQLLHAVYGMLKHRQPRRRKLYRLAEILYAPFLEHCSAEAA